MVLGRPHSIFPVDKCLAYKNGLFRKVSSVKSARSMGWVRHNVCALKNVVEIVLSPHKSV